MNRAVGEEKMRAADVQAPKVKSVALILGTAGSEGVRAERAVRGKSSDIQLSDAEYHVRRAVFGLAFAGIPPAQDAVCARRASPTQSVLLVPSLMSVRRIAESTNKTPLWRNWFVPSTPR
jgi:hypothetical protein